MQSNGAAEWLKMSLATARGICAATRVELPGRFLWRAYRQVLGRDRVTPQSALEREALAWRLMRLLPTLLDRPAFAPVASFLAGGDVDRRLQLARHLADLYDQYQVYRADWLAAWEAGRAAAARVRRRRGAAWPTTSAGRWRCGARCVGELSGDERASTRPHVHRAFIAALQADARGAEALPRRVVLFGAAHIPAQTLEALAALSTRVQVIARRARIPAASTGPTSSTDAKRCGRCATACRRARTPTCRPRRSRRCTCMRIRCSPPGAARGATSCASSMRSTMPRESQRRFDAAARRPVRRRAGHDAARAGAGEHPRPGAAVRASRAPRSRRPTVRSSSTSRTARSARSRSCTTSCWRCSPLPTVRPLGPRDVVVMVPDIEVFAPAIRAVFGQYPRHDARSHPVRHRRPAQPRQQSARGRARVAAAHRRRAPAPAGGPRPARRAGDRARASASTPTRCPGLFDWLAGAGVRWGLHEAHRARLGLGATGRAEQLAVRPAPHAARLRDRRRRPVRRHRTVRRGRRSRCRVSSARSRDLVDALGRWWTTARGHATPREWAARARTLLGDFFSPVDERERLTMAALQAALSAWLEACDAARFVESVPLSVVREAWLSGVDGLDTNRRFLAGGVTFCTLLPLRAVPFDVVCLLGMNDGDFPRRGQRDDFDLMALPNQQRPGDRSRRDDDRYLMLEALLSARRVLYVSWCGRSARDNGAQPPSVLVSQLRDYLRGGWRPASGADVVDERTTEHPLQPFSRRYFESPAATGLVTFAREWRVAHDDRHAQRCGGADAALRAGRSSVDGDRPRALPEEPGPRVLPHAARGLRAARRGTRRRRRAVRHSTGSTGTGCARSCSTPPWTARPGRTSGCGASGAQAACRSDRSARGSPTRSARR